MREMFGIIAPRYDFITRLFSYGMDASWKRRGIEECALRPGMRVLDLACGTGDFAQLAAARGATAIGADLTMGMMRESKTLPIAVCADAQQMPFEDGSFDAVCVGYGVRNFPKLTAAIAEIHRVLKPGGTVVVLDFYLPGNPVWRWLFLSYLYAQGWLWGLLLHGQPRIYTYIPRSLRSFVSTARFAELLAAGGFTKVRCQSFLGGGIALHWGAKST